MKKSIMLLSSLLFTLALFAPETHVLDIPSGQVIKVSDVELRKEAFWVFSDSIGYYESRGIWDTVNSIGYAGKYQMGMAARIETGYGHIKNHTFKKNPNIWPEEEQDIAFSRYTRLNEIRLEDIIAKYDNTHFDRVNVTKSGILAAAHLAGFNNVRKYFENDGKFNPKDIYGTRLKDYLIRFEGYKF